MSHGPIFQRKIIYQAKTEPVRVAPEAVTESRWHQPWSDPVRRLQVPLRPDWPLATQQLAPRPISTVTMAASEANADSALLAINVLSSPPPSAVSANVSIVEV